MGQTPTTSSKAESYTWGTEIECFLPESKVQELGISIGSCRRGRRAARPSAGGRSEERAGEAN